MRSPSARPALPFVPARYYDALVRFLEERGIAPLAALEGTGVTRELLAGDDTYLTLDQVEALVLWADAVASGDAVAIGLGRTFEMPSHGALGLAMLTAKDVDAALAVASRYFGLVMPFFDLELAGGSGAPRRVRLRARWPLEPRVERFHVIALAGGIQAQSKLVLRGLDPGGVEADAKFARPDVSARLDAPGVALRFDRPFYEARIPAELAAVPLPLAHARSHAAACATCDALLAARPDPSRVAASVRLRLDRAGPPFPDLETVARSLGASTRTLRRRLASEGTSFRAILDEVRVGLADEWLARGDRSITEIGLELGYADSANFTRAYRRARGRPPVAARGSR